MVFYFEALESRESLGRSRLWNETAIISVGGRIQAGQHVTVSYLPWKPPRVHERPEEDSLRASFQRAVGGLGRTFCPLVSHALFNPPLSWTAGLVHAVRFGLAMRLPNIIVFQSFT